MTRKVPILLFFSTRNRHSKLSTLHHRNMTYNSHKVQCFQEWFRQKCMGKVYQWLIYINYNTFKGLTVIIVRTWQILSIWSKTNTTNALCPISWLNAWIRAGGQDSCNAVAKNTQWYSTRVSTQKLLWNRNKYGILLILHTHYLTSKYEVNRKLSS